MLQLETERLLLRPLEESDAPRVQELANDPTISAMTLTFNYPFTEADAMAFIARMRESFEAGMGCVFAIIPKQEDVIVGVVGIHAVSAHQRAELGFWMGQTYRGGGYMTEAVRRVIQYGFEAYGLYRIHAACFVSNDASKRVMEKVGMTYEGRLRGHFLRHEQFHDALYYGILRDEWQKGTQQ